MSTHEELKEAAERFSRSVQAVDDDDDDDDDVGELEVSEYIILMLAFDTFVRYVEETTGIEDPEPGDSSVPPKYRSVMGRGLKLLRIIEGELTEIKGFLDETLPNKGQKAMLAKAMRLRVTSANGACWRAFMLNRVLGMGGSKTQRAVFKTNLMLQQVRKAIAAVDLEDGDAALDIFAALVIRNARIRAWIDLAAKVAGSEPEAARPVPTIMEEQEEVPKEKPVAAPPPAPPKTDREPIGQAATVASDQASKLLVQNVEASAAGSDGAEEADARRRETLRKVEREATEAARKTLTSPEDDAPPTRSEVVGMATAAAVAAVSDPALPTNIPASLSTVANDPEQLAAALTDGKVLVTAGAGSGKTRCLVARIKYLLNERGVLPTRIMATSFNKKAGRELKGKVAELAGLDVAKQMTIGTMNSLFSRGVSEHGNAVEQSMMGKGFVEGGYAVANEVQRLYPLCYPEDIEGKAPKKKDAMTAMTSWRGNDISPEQALNLAKTPKEKSLAKWYVLYEGFKGAMGPDWQPECEERLSADKEGLFENDMEAWRQGRRRSKPQKSWFDKRRQKVVHTAKYQTVFQAFMANKRPGGLRLGDFQDQIKIFRDILQRNPAVKAEYQRRFDHILVDEAQDLDAVQTQIVEMMSEHVTDGSDGKSLWLVGDQNQAIYEFRGARPDLFVGKYEKEGWKSRIISTNYRSEPEIVEHANKLISHNPTLIPMEAKPAPGRTRGNAKIEVRTPKTDVGGAMQTIEAIKAEVERRPEGKERNETPGEYAVLVRTNKELNAFETACILRGVPYARKGSGSFLGSPETTAMQSYTALAVGGEPPALQKAFSNILNFPGRFFIKGMNREAMQERVKKAFTNYAARLNVPRNRVDPTEAIEDPEFQDLLLRSLYESRFSSRADWQVDQDRQKLSELSDSLRELSFVVKQGGSTKDLFDTILAIETEQRVYDKEKNEEVYKYVTLRESIEADLRDRTDPESDDAENDVDSDLDEYAGLGNIAYLYELTKVDPTDPEDVVMDPNTPDGFKAKMVRYAGRARELRLDINEWYAKNLEPPPEHVYLGTAHSTKGGQWENVTVQMPAGRFPMEPFIKPGEPPPPPEEIQAQLESERRLAYVALTRPMTNLTIMCPDQLQGMNAGGVSRFVEEAGFAVTTGGDEEPVTKEASEASEVEPWDPDDISPWDFADFEGEV